MQVINILSDSVVCNTYILTNGQNEAVVIDPGDNSVFYELQKRNLICKHVLLTHGHFDHTGGVRLLSENGAKIFCGEFEKNFIFSQENLGIFGGVDIPYFEVDGTVSDGDEKQFCGLKIRTLFTPGHTCGSVCYIVGNKIFTGDTLFKGSAGRTDLPTGNYMLLRESLKKLFNLPGNYELCCGHGCRTTLENERKYNPFAGNNRLC